MLSELSVSKLSKQYLSAIEKNDASTIKDAEQEALNRLTGFLNSEIDVEPEQSPFWLTFLRTFSQTDDIDLKMVAKKAEVKLIPLLKEFDNDMGLDFSQQVDTETLERNLADLDSFEKINPFERDDFRQILKLIEKAELFSDDETPYETADFLEDVQETAQLKTFLRLCLNLDKITDDLYFFVLKREMESFLMTLLLTEASETAFETGSTEEIQAEFERFLNAID